MEAAQTLRDLIEAYDQIVEEGKATIPLDHNRHAIEVAFSKVKPFLRRQEARTREALQEALSQALDLITEADAKGWFTHCGYPPPVLDEMAQ